LLAVVVDDAAQRISHVVRGADLLDNTPRQIYLQRLLGVGSPVYAHVPLLVEPDGSKLAKTLRSVPVERQDIIPTLVRVFRLLTLTPPAELFEATPAEAWAWAVQQFRIERIAKRLQISVCKP
jgi:glutamyl-Q tRNA(Asp) synthetase